MIPVEWYMMLSIVVFGIGTAGFFIRRNIIIMFISIELMLNGVNISLVAFSHYLQDLRGQILVFLVIAVAAAEAAIGLAILIVLYKNKETIHIDDVSELHW